MHKFVDYVPNEMPIENVCRACQLGKAHKLPFTKNFRRELAVGQIMHSNIMGKLTMSYPDRYQYVCTFLDYHSRYTLLTFLFDKSDVHNAFQKMLIKMKSNFNDSVSIQQSRRIMEFHSDAGKEYKKLET